MLGARARDLAVLALHFLQAPAIDGWEIQEFKKIRENDSLRAILEVLLNYDLEEDNPQIVLPGIVRKCTLTKDPKHTYAILLPQPHYFLTEDFEAISLHHFQMDPSNFIREHLDNLPRSIRVQSIHRNLQQIRDLQNNEKIASFGKSLATEVTASAVSYGICTAFNLPPESREIISVVIGPLIDLARRKSD